MRRNNWIAQEKCVYCRAKRGKEHDPTCVTRKKTVVVRMTLEYVVLMPESWEKEDIEFQRNDSSWSASNAAYEIMDLVERDEDACMMQYKTNFEYVREATEEDEEANLLFIEDV